MTEIKAGDKVHMHYTGRLQDGSVFDSSEGRPPLSFTAGGDEVIPGISHSVIGMNVGDKKTLEVPPEEGFGERHPNRSQQIRRDQLPEDISVGVPLSVRGSEDQPPFTVWVTELDEETATLDANHPLAGQTVIFDIELVSGETS